MIPARSRKQPFDRGVSIRRGRWGERQGPLNANFCDARLPRRAKWISATAPRTRGGRANICTVPAKYEPATLRVARGWRPEGRRGSRFPSPYFLQRLARGQLDLFPSIWTRIKKNFIPPPSLPPVARGKDDVPVGRGGHLEARPEYAEVN